MADKLDGIARARELKVKINRALATAKVQAAAYFDADLLRITVGLHHYTDFRVEMTLLVSTDEYGVHWLVFTDTGKDPEQLRGDDLDEIAHEIVLDLVANRCGAQ